MKHVLSLLGLCRRAGSLVFGFDAVKRAIRIGRTHLVIIAEDASLRTRSQMMTICKEAYVSAAVWGKKDDIGRAIGRNDVAVVAMTDSSLSIAVSKAIAGVQVEKGRDLNGKNASLRISPRHRDRE